MRVLVEAPRLFSATCSAMLLRRVYASLARSQRQSVLPRLVSDPSARLSAARTQLGFSKHRESLGPPLMASGCRSDEALRRRYIPLPPDSADKDQMLRGLEATLGSPFSSDPYTSPAKPLIIVISGPSGVGKDAVIKRLQEVREGIHFVVTATSRTKRPGEIDGKDYYFVSKEEFLFMIERGELLEYALVYGEYKGIPKQQIRDFMAKGHDIVLRVDVQGAATLRSILGNSAVFIFLVAESEQALAKRLVNRKTETNDMMLVRIATARVEVKCMKDFDYVVVNAEGRLDASVKLVESIIDAEKARVCQRSVSL